MKFNIPAAVGASKGLAQPARINFQESGKDQIIVKKGCCRWVGRITRADGVWSYNSEWKISREEMKKVNAKVAELNS